LSGVGFRAHPGWTEADSTFTTDASVVDSNVAIT
jgi:hypothetical protein